MTLAAPAAGQGLVTSMVAHEDVVWSCTQTGIRKAGRRVEPAGPGRPTALARSGNTLFVAGGTPGVSGHVARRDGRPVVISKDVVYDVACAGGYVVAACADGYVRLLDAKLKLLGPTARHTAAARAVDITRDGSLVASAGLDGVVLLWRPQEKAALKALTEHTAGCDALEIAPGGNLIASGARDGRVRLHEPTGRFIRTYRRLPDQVWALAWSPDGRLFAGCADGSVWELSKKDDSITRLENAGPRPVASLLSTRKTLYIGTNVVRQRRFQ